MFQPVWFFCNFFFAYLPQIQRQRQQQHYKHRVYAHEHATFLRIVSARQRYATQKLWLEATYVDEANAKNRFDDLRYAEQATCNTKHFVGQFEICMLTSFGWSLGFGVGGLNFGSI